jgi:hypothetical protein
VWTIGYLIPKHPLPYEHACVVDESGKVLALTGPSTNQSSVTLAHKISRLPELRETLAEMSARYERLEKLYSEATGTRYDAENGMLARARELLAKTGEDGNEVSIIDAVITHLRLNGYVIDDRDAADIRAHLKAMPDVPDNVPRFADLVASVMVYKSLTANCGDCANCQDTCVWDGNWNFDATSPMGERDTFGTYLEKAEARAAMKRLKKKGYTDFNGPYQPTRR